MHRLASLAVILALVFASRPQLADAQTPPSLTATPAQTYAGLPVTFTADTPIGGTLAFGDGASTSVAAGAAMVAHTYMRAGSYGPTLTYLLKPGAVPSTLITHVLISSPTGTVNVSPNATLVGLPVSIAATLTGAPRLPPPPNATLAFGDGSSSIVTAGSIAFSHVYRAPGLFAVRLLDNLGNVLSTATVSAGVQSGALTALPARAPVGSLIGFGVTLLDPAGVGAGATVRFGDASAPVPVSASTRLSHAYAAPGLYTATLLSATGAPLAFTAVRADMMTARVPIGQIFDVTPTLAPVLAGTDETLFVTYNLAVPRTALTSVNPPLEVIVDLLDAKDRLIRRSDPFALQFNGASGPTIRVARIPYAVPVDAAGSYKLRVYIRNAEGGGTVAVARSIPFAIVGGPDPRPVLHSSVHAKGSIEIGPQAGESGDTLNAGITNALQWPSGTLGLTGLFDPLSHRADPQLFYRPGAPSQTTNPDNAVEGASANAPAPGFNGALGREQASLPQILGGGDAIRGFDSTDLDGLWSYHFGYGYTQLSTDTTSPEFGSIFDVTRTLKNNGSVRVAVLSRVDRMAGYIPSGSEADDPSSSHALALEFQQTVMPNLTVDASGAFAERLDEVAPAQPTLADAADKLSLNYTHDRVNVGMEYDDAGPEMALGGGPGALADRASFLSSLNVMLSPVSTLSFGWNVNSTRSAFSRQTDGFATLSLTPAKLPSVTLTYRRDGQQATGTGTRSDEWDVALSKAFSVWSATFTGSVTSLIDTLQGLSSSIARVGSLQFARQGNRHTLSFGISANEVAGIAPAPAPSARPGGPGALASNTANVSEIVSYGFPFATRANGNGFELMLQGTNTNSHAPGLGTRDDELDAILAYHLGQHVTIGLREETRLHWDLIPANDSSASALRLRLDVQF